MVDTAHRGPRRVFSEPIWGNVRADRRKTAVQLPLSLRSPIVGNRTHQLPGSPRLLEAACVDQYQLFD